jgi:tRNA(Leu) C34 or U34 (ribose-2'-O)-methylase TrmL
MHMLRGLEVVIRMCCAVPCKCHLFIKTPTQTIFSKQMTRANEYNYSLALHTFHKSFKILIDINNS